MRRLLSGDCTPDVFLGYSTGRRPRNAKLENPRPILPAVELMGRGASFYGLTWTKADAISLHMPYTPELMRATQGYDFGDRIDGTPKGPGFAAQTLPGGSVMTELSLGTPEFLYPAVYKGITPEDMSVLYAVAANGSHPDEFAVHGRAYDAALLRAMRGLSPFWTPADGVSGMEMLEMFSPPPLQY